MTEKPISNAELQDIIQAPGPVDPELRKWYEDIILPMVLKLD